MSRDFRPHRAPVDVLNYEIAQEKAVALGRLGRALEEALAKLRELNAAHLRSSAPAFRVDRSPRARMFVRSHVAFRDGIAPRRTVSGP
ncbi:MAG: hypothetical protein E6G80_11310 [Alphaproteobacteria bacterium]|nr:MAG: hypothetical protein E6G80_11310 [Alphaproteobacteria bacterium]